MFPICVPPLKSPPFAASRYASLVSKCKLRFAITVHENLSMCSVAWCCSVFPVQRKLYLSRKISAIKSPLTLQKNLQSSRQIHRLLKATQMFASGSEISSS